MFIEVADTLLDRLEDFLATQEDVSIKDLYQATRALFAVTQIKENTLGNATLPKITATEVCN